MLVSVTRPQEPPRSPSSIERFPSMSTLAIQLVPTVCLLRAADETLDVEETRGKISIIEDKQPGHGGR